MEIGSEMQKGAEEIEHAVESMGERAAVEKRKKQFVSFLKKQPSLIFYAILAFILYINVLIRTMPMKLRGTNPGLWDVAANHWTLGPDLDPFLFMRYAKEIVANGQLAAIDMMRYTPLGFETARETMVLPYMIAYLHKALNFFGEFSVEYAAIIFPVIISCFTAIFFFLLVRKIFEAKGLKVSNIIALISTTIMVVLPNLLSRTIAGIPEKESVGFALMFLALYLFLCAWKSDKLRSILIFGILAGFVTAMLGLVWGGVVFVYVSISLSAGLAFILRKVDRKEFIIYSTWLFSSMIFWIPFTLKKTLRSFVVSPTTGIALAVWFFMFMHILLYKTKLKEIGFIDKIKIKKLPPRISTIIISLVLMVLIFLIFFGYKSFFNIGRELYYSLIQNTPTRLISTVAENRQSYFSEIKNALGPIVKGFPVLFWLFFTGSVLLFFETVKALKSKEKWILTAGYTFFLWALIFSRTSPSSLLNGDNTISIALNVLAYVGLFASAVYVYYKRFEARELDGLKNINFSYIFVVALTFVGIIAARSGVRFVMVFTPIATIGAGYLGIQSWILALKSKQDIKKVLFWILVILVTIGLIVTIQTYYNVSKGNAYNHVPNQYTHQWQYAMEWVRENTPEDAVFGHWWDYGYWLQSIGERATMLDGGNFIAYWNYLMGRHVLTAESEREALELLHNHDVDYYLIDSTDIGKYSAYSLIGSNENYDRYSWIGNFFLDVSQTQETKDQVISVYTGGVGMDEDLVIKQNGKEVLIPGQGGGVYLILVYKNQDGNYDKAEIFVTYNNKQYRLPLRYLYIDGELIDFGVSEEDTVGGCAYVFTKLEDDGRINPYGAAMYLSPRNMRALWVKLYLFNQENNFKLVHAEKSALHKNLESQGVSTSELVYYHGLHGPIKIWEIKYRGDEKSNPEYIQEEFPERILSRMYQ